MPCRKFLCEEANAGLVDQTMPVACYWVLLPRPVVQEPHFQNRNHCKVICIWCRMREEKEAVWCSVAQLLPQLDGQWLAPCIDTIGTPAASCPLGDRDCKIVPHLERQHHQISHFALCWLGFGDHQQSGREDEKLARNPMSMSSSSGSQSFWK